MKKYLKYASAITVIACFVIFILMIISYGLIIQVKRSGSIIQEGTVSNSTYYTSVKITGLILVFGKNGYETTSKFELANITYILIILSIIIIFVALILVIINKDVTNKISAFLNYFVSFLLLSSGVLISLTPTIYKFINYNNDGYRVSLTGTWIAADILLYFFAIFNVLPAIFCLIKENNDSMKTITIEQEWTNYNFEFDWGY